jgi:hypothetical protein
MLFPSYKNALHRFPIECGPGATNADDIGRKPLLDRNLISRQNAQRREFAEHGIILGFQMGNPMGIARSNRGQSIHGNQSPEVKNRLGQIGLLRVEKVDFP